MCAHAHAHENDDAAAAAVAAVDELELVMSPQQSQLMISDPDHNNCVFKEDATEIISNEVDPELFQILLNNTVTDHNHADSSKRVTKKRNANDDDLKSVKLYKKIYMRRKTRKHNNN